jgi:hypothetical protein
MHAVWAVSKLPDILTSDDQAKARGHHSLHKNMFFLPGFHQRTRVGSMDVIKNTRWFDGCQLEEGQ